MKASSISIRDPFVLAEDGTYYLYGTRSENFGIKTSGFDVYVSDRLDGEWSGPHEVFNSEKHGLNRHANWAPEVHKYKGSYYMFATFMQEDGLRGTYILKAESPMGPFLPHSDGAVTPRGWECLDGTFYVSRAGEPYIVFCHEHTQIIDGKVCSCRLNEELSAIVGDPRTLFYGSDFRGGKTESDTYHYITDGPFMHRSVDGGLLMLWSSTNKDGQYVQALARSTNGEIDGDFVQQKPIFEKDGGHGMLFRDFSGKLWLTLHTPNKQPLERPVFLSVGEL